MVKVRFVSSPTHVELVGCSSISGRWDDFERLQASIYLSSVEPRIRFKTFYNRLSAVQTEQILDYILENDLNLLRHTWTSFTTNCSRIATIDEESEHHSYTEKSQRYTLASPKSHLPDGVENDDRLSRLFREAVQSSFELYHSMKRGGIMLEDARDILSLSAMTSVVSTRSTYDELFYLSSCIRGDKPKEIQDIGRKQYRILHSIAPNIFDKEMEILKKFNPRKSFASTKYKNQNVEEVLSTFQKSELEEPFCSSGAVDITTGPTRPGLIPGIAAKTTRVIQNFTTLKRQYEMNRISDREVERTLQKVMESGHTSVAEHDYYVLMSSITNSLAHQMVRHRHIWDTYTYLVEAGKNFRFLTPHSAASKGFSRAFLQVADKQKEAFDRLVDSGIREAYYVLPNATLVDVYVTTNAAEILHMIRRRTCRLAQDPIRLRFAIPLWKELMRSNPAIFANSGPDCLTNECHEKWPCKTPYEKQKSRKAQSVANFKAETISH